MIRTPLRPLAQILRARATGEDPDAIERANRRVRTEVAADGVREMAEGRLFLLGLGFFCAFVTIALRMGAMAASDPVEPLAVDSGPAIVASRANITDRNGRILATNISTHALYAQPQHMIDPVGAAAALTEIFPDLDAERLKSDFTGPRKFIWIKKKLSPEQMQAVHDIGEPGLLFGPREMRLYPNGRLAAHVLGGASFGREGVASAEVIGVAGVERKHDDFLRDPGFGGAPLRLSLDLTVQAATRETLLGGMRLMNAKGASSVLMDVKTGEILSLVSLPDFDPNDRPHALLKGDQSDSPLFNRAVQGVYELGSVFKIFTTAQAMELGLVNDGSMIETKAPLRWGKHRIGEFGGRNYGPELSVRDIVVKSSNVGTARLAQMITVPRHQEFLGRLGLLEPTDLEVVEATTGRPLLPPHWSEISTMTISYGHGLSTSPVHLAGAYASLLNGGTLVRPTLLRQSGPQQGERIVSEQNSASARAMLRAVVTEGTASFGEVAGYRVGGKTGTADKPKPHGGYYKDKVIATFASVFPADDPKYVLIVTLDEPEDRSGEKPRRTAGWTATPVAAEIIRRAAPLLGLRPLVEPRTTAAVRASYD